MLCHPLAIIDRELVMITLENYFFNGDNITIYSVQNYANDNLGWIH